jgi:hypothetical protein
LNRLLEGRAYGAISPIVQKIKDASLASFILGVLGFLSKQNDVFLRCTSRARDLTLMTDEENYQTNLPELVREHVVLEKV